MYIRFANPEDITAITQIEWDSFGRGVATKRETYEEKFVRQAEHFLIAEESNQIIGFIEGLASNQRTIEDEMFRNAETHNPDGEWEMIISLAVSEDAQGKGVGKQLLKELIEQARQRKQKGVVLTCKESLIPYYQAFGFVDEGVSDSVLGGVKWYDMRLEF